MLTKQELIDFEIEIAQLFENKQIKAPVHLRSSNEDILIEIFKNIRENDWICGTWAFHLECLLKGVPKEELKNAILQGKSIGLQFPQYKIITSAMVGGICSIALGIAYSNKLLGVDDYVYCFVGDTSSETGSFYECVKYAYNHQLPIKFIIADNGKSVNSPTREIWGNNKLTFEKFDNPMIIYYKYESKYPHVGIGKTVIF